MTVSEFRFVVLDDPILALLSVAGVVAVLLGLVLRGRGGRAAPARQLIVTGLVLLGAAVVYALMVSWLSAPVPLGALAGPAGQT